MPEMHLTKPGFTYSACGTFTKNKERINKFKESRYIYQNELDKTCFWHDMSYVDFKDLSRKTFAGKVLRDKAFNIASIYKDPIYGGYQHGFASMDNTFFDKKLLVVVLKSKKIVIKN